MFGLVVLMYGLMGLAFPFGKWAMACTFSPAYVIAFRSIPTGLAFLWYANKAKRNAVVVGNSDEWHWYDVYLFGVVGLTAVYLHLVPEYWSMKFIDSVKANFIYSLNPFISALLSYAIISERLSRKQWAAMALGFAGMVPVILSGGSGEIGLTQMMSMSLPELAMILSTVSLAYTWFAVKKLSQRGYSLPMINGSGMLIGGIMCLAHFFYFHGLQLFPVTDPVTFIALSLVLVLVSNITTYTMYSYLLKTYSVTFLSFCGFLLPIFGAVYGKLIWNEAITWHYGVALVCISAGLWMFYLESRDKQTSLL